MAERIISEAGKIKYVRYTLPATRKPYLELYKNKTTSDLKELYIAAIAELEECVNSEKKVQLRAQLGAIEELLSGRHNKIERQLINEKTDGGEVASQTEWFKVLSTASLKLQYHIFREGYLKTAMENTEQRAKLYDAMAAINVVLSKRTEKELETMTQEEP